MSLYAQQRITTEHQRYAHCDHRKAGAEGTIWCKRCLAWWRREYARELDEAEKVQPQ